MTLSVSLDHLPRLASMAAVPRYARAALRPGILHFGVGNFHRAHQAVYLDDLFNMGLGQDWAILGAGVTAHDSAMRDRLRAQECLTTVVEQDASGQSARITGAMLDVLDPDDPQAIIAAMADTAIRIVSLTITEGGYFIDPATGRFQATHPAMRADAAQPMQPRTVFGLILAALRLRRERSQPPFTVMSCDNIPGNGDVARQTLCGLAALSGDTGLAEWLRSHVACPNSMVDRITPATGPHEIAACRDDLGLADASPVFCEPFRQWVIEDHFPAGRPPLEAVGVTFVEDVAPFELMKIRILNGGHAALAYPAALLDIVHVHDAMQDPQITGFLARLQRSEILPCVPEVPGTDLTDYLRTIEERLANPKVADTVARLAQDGSNRQPKFILPSTADRIAAGQDVTGLALVTALWCRYLQGQTDSGAAIAVQDMAADRLTAAARAATQQPQAFLDLTEVFGPLGTAPLFQRRFAEALGALLRCGTRATLAAYAEGRDLATLEQTTGARPCA